MHAVWSTRVISSESSRETISSRSGSSNAIATRQDVSTGRPSIVPPFEEALEGPWLRGHRTKLAPRLVTADENAVFDPWSPLPFRSRGRRLRVMLGPAARRLDVEVGERAGAR